jgi:hypothetical protein
MSTEFGRLVDNLKGPSVQTTGAVELQGVLTVGEPSLSQPSLTYAPSSNSQAPPRFCRIADSPWASRVVPPHHRCRGGDPGPPIIPRQRTVP